METNLIAFRTKHDIVVLCSGCGKNSRTIYEVSGRHDYAESGFHNWTLCLCWPCFRPLKNVIDLICPPTTPT